jgi:hypothetical protein
VALPLRRTTPRTRAFEGIAASRRHVILVASYAVIASALIWSRFAAIGTSFWHDEIFTVQHFIDPGPRAIFGAYDSNDHILFSLLGWLTVHRTGFGESAYRLWAIVPFIAGVASVTYWLHTRANAVVAVVFAFLCTTSTLLFTLSIEARGYGLAFFAMSIMTIAAYEASTRRSRRSLTILATAGVIGCWTIPTFILPLIGLSLVLLSKRALRRPLTGRLVVAFAAIGCWYAVPARSLLSSRGQQFGVTLPWHAPLTGAANTLGAAFFLSVKANELLPALLTLPILIFGIIRMSRELPAFVSTSASPVLSTFTALTISRFYVEERFLSFLLVPIFIIAAFGVWALATSQPRHHWTLFASRAGAGCVALFLFSAVLSSQFTRMPREANREAARAVSRALTASQRPVVMNTEHPADIRYYLTRLSPRVVPARRLEQVLCSQSTATTGVIFVQQPYGVRRVDASCLARRGAILHMFHQWDRGLGISVWVLPPRSGDSSGG